MIEISNLSKAYGEIEALKPTSLVIQAGQIVGLLGPNGAGKTTLMKLITGVLEPDDGTVQVNGMDGIKERQKVQEKIGYLPENAPIYPDLTVQDYLLMMAKLHRIPGDQQKDFVIDAIKAVNLEQVVSRPIGELSKGMRQRVGLAQAILHKPEILVLDEPTVGLDPTQIIEIRQLIRNLAKQSTILFSTHILPEVEAICDRVIIIMNGSVKADSKLSDLAKTNNAVMILDAEQPRAENLIKQIQGVVSVRKEVNEEGDSQYLVQGAEGVDLLPQLFQMASREKLPLRELRKEIHTLETVFNELAMAE